MKERREPRFQANQPAWVTLLDAAVDTRLPGRIRDVSGRGIGLEVQRPIGTGTPLKIEVEDTLLLGEVIYCRADRDCFYAGVELEHALGGLVELSEAVRGFRNEPSGPEQHQAVQYAHDQDQHERH